MRREEYGKFKIALYGSVADTAEARKRLDEISLIGNEHEDRLKIQEAIDKHKIKAHILYDGNSVYSYDRIVKDFKRALKSNPSPMNEYGSGDYDLTNYLYDFLSLACGSIAHFNKYGWIGTYPQKEDLKRFCRSNEYRQNILDYQPSWATDRRRIAKSLLEICDKNKFEEVV